MSVDARYLLIGFYGRRNLGDDLMAHALIGLLRDRGIQNISVMSGDPKPFSGQDVEIVSRRVLSLIKAIAATDTLIQGGGTIFHDSYQGRALYRYWINLTLYLCIFMMARLLGKKVYLLGAGIGPIRHPVSRLICRIALSFAHGIQVRDTASMDDLRGLLPRKKNFVQAYDLALLYPVAEAPRARQDAPRRVIGISVCDLHPFYPQDPNGPWRAMAEALRTAFPEPEHARIELRFLACFTPPTDQSDTIISHQIASELLPEFQCTHFNYDSDPEVFLEALSACEALIATRFHAAISGFKLNIPVLPVAYNRKVADFCFQIGMDPQDVLSLEAASDAQNWLRCLPALEDDALWAQRRAGLAQMKQHLAAAIGEVLEGSTSR